MSESRPDWTRIIWANKQAREMWEPRIQAIQREWARVEVASVAHGLRSAALVFGQPEVSYPLLKREVVANRWAVTRTQQTLEELWRFYGLGDDDSIGYLLGYPGCCRAFFSRTWGGSNVDTTWEMSSGGSADGPVACNILGRWLGVRLVPHLPCSFECSATVLNALQLSSLWSPQELAWAQEILRWPCEWSAVHGIAEVKFPTLKLSTRTTKYPEKRTVRRQGSSPEEAARGNSFPYQKTVVNPLTILRPEDNGFSQVNAMHTAHEMILGALHEAPPRGEVLDLGAGNGELMHRIEATFHVPVSGIEINARKAALDTRIRCENLNRMDSSPRYVDTIVVSIRRFEEIPGLDVWCKKNARQVLTYSYDHPMFTNVEARCLSSK